MTNRVVLGVTGTEEIYLPGGGVTTLEKFGMKVSLPGVNVLSYTSEKQLVFNSDWIDNSKIMLKASFGTRKRADLNTTYSAVTKVVPWTAVSFIPTVIIHRYAPASTYAWISGAWQTVTYPDDGYYGPDIYSMSNAGNAPKYYVRKDGLYVYGIFYGGDKHDVYVLNVSANDTGSAGGGVG